LDDGIECASLVGFFGKFLRLTDGRQVSDENPFSLRNSFFGGFRFLSIASVKSYLMASFAEGFCGCETDAIARSSDEDPYHFDRVIALKLSREKIDECLRSLTLEGSIVNGDNSDDGGGPLFAEKILRAWRRSRSTFDARCIA